MLLEAQVNGSDAGSVQYPLLARGGRKSQICATLTSFPQQILHNKIKVNRRRRIEVGDIKLFLLHLLTVPWGQMSASPQSWRPNPHS